MEYKSTANKYITTPKGVYRRQYRSYESDILNILDEKQMNSFKAKTRLLFEILPDNSLVSLRKKIKQKKNRPSIIEDLLIEYFKKYNIQEPIKKKYKRKKESAESVKKRVEKFRDKTDKVSLQFLVNKNIKIQFDKLKDEHNLTSEKLLQRLLNGYI